MIITLKQLLSELQAGELVEHRHANVELKRSWSQEVGKKISSNGNKTHLPVAWVVIGVDDGGNPVAGCDEAWAKKTELEVSGQINQYLEPAQTCQSLECFVFDGKWLIVIKLANPGAVVLWNKRAYKSAGTTLREMEPHEQMELTVALPGLIDYSKQPWSGPVDSTVVQAFTSRVAKTSSELFSLQQLDPEAALHRLCIRDKVVCRLLFGNAGFRLVFNNAAGVPVRNETIRPLYRIFSSQLYEEIDDYAHQGRSLQGRVYPPPAFQEAIANAVAHAAYFENDGEIMLELFPDRLCIGNLCMRESRYFANRWFSRSHRTVNALLMETLRLARHVDELGRGKTLIFNEFIANGRAAPSVVVEGAGRYSRWKLTLSAGFLDERHTKLLDRLREHYSDEQKALMAFALVLWRGMPVEQIRNFVDGESARLLAELLNDINGATFYFEAEDVIVLNRWARLLLQEGMESKALNPAEEERLFRLASGLAIKHKGGLITPKEIRQLAELGHAAGASKISSLILKKWADEGKCERLRVGRYRFVKRSKPADNTEELIGLLTPNGSKNDSPADPGGLELANPTQPKASCGEKHPNRRP